ncbi:unnamed protein product, partial [Choristocarpus tenellus]
MYERQLSADHMRRLNQALAGHVGFEEIINLHTKQEDTLDSRISAPAHGAALGESSQV